MKNFAKMALMSGSPDRGRMDTNGGNMNYGNMGYDMESRFRDRRGREHYDNGRYAPRNESSGTLTWDNSRGAEGAYRGNYGRFDMDEPESRRRRDSRGRFRSEMDDDADMRYPMYPPPVYEEYGGMNQIGFAAHDGSNRGGLHMLRGGAAQDKSMDRNKRHSDEMPKFDHAAATDWMERIENEDGSKGAHWTQDQTTQVMKKKGYDCDPVEFWVIMNAVYSDYVKVAKKYNVNNVDYYADLAKAWLSDSDAVADKVAAYYYYVAK